MSGILFWNHFNFAQMVFYLFQTVQKYSFFPVLPVRFQTVLPVLCCSMDRVLFYLIEIIKIVLLIYFKIYGFSDMPLEETIYSTSQISIPAELPDLLKQYTKAAIRTQPPDILQWYDSFL